MASCVSYTNQNQVYDHQSLSAPDCGFGFGRISCTVSAGSPVQFRFPHPPAEYPCPGRNWTPFCHSAAGRFSRLCLPHIQKWKAPRNVSPSSEKCFFLPELFLLSTLFFPPVFVVFAFWHDVYYHNRREKSTKFLAYSAQRWKQKIVYDTNQKSKPHVALCGAFVGKGKPLGGNKTTPDRATQWLYEPQCH